ncbi:MAG TPA: hypothetical protein PKC96_01500 [Bacilli bacterium]|nr:hypothetical protein [Bacilli bacterium]
MKIQIQNYNNISNLTYEIQNNHINFLFGISGSGKSSIASALANQDELPHLQIGAKPGTMNVLVDGSTVSHDRIKIFDMNYCNDVLIEKTKKSDIYSILYGEGGKIEECKSSYLSAINDLLLVKDKVVFTLSDIRDIVDELKVAYKKDKYSSACLIHKMTKNVESLPNYRNVITYSSKEIKWVLDGTKMLPFADGKCPFCGSKLKNRRKEQIESIISFDSKTFEKINSKTDAFLHLGIVLPDWKKKREIALFDKRLKEMFALKPELESFCSFLDISSINNAQFFSTLSVPTPSTRCKKLFPEIYDAFIAFSGKAKDVKRTYGALKAETEKTLNKHSKIINEKLNILGIPYKFCKTLFSEDEKEAEYVIAHNQDINEVNDMSLSLSFGEKNLISLLLFLLANSKYEMLVIDDPASSFDEYRRKVIFDIIYELHENSTVLVLSHDLVFAKFAVFHSEKSIKEISSHKDVSPLQARFANDTGFIDYLETFDKDEIRPIKSSDFDSLESFIDKRLSSFAGNMNYQISINLRLYFEVTNKVSKNSVIYQYLSAIIHKTKYEEIIELLKSKKTNENKILKQIRDKSGHVFGPLSITYNEEIDTSAFSNFEKVFLARESLGRGKHLQAIKDELNNIVHLNCAYAICLNPYSFSYFSKFVYDYISKI